MYISTNGNNNPYVVFKYILHVGLSYKVYVIIS